MFTQKECKYMCMQHPQSKLCAGERHLGLQVMQPLKLFHLIENRYGSTLSVKFSSNIISENLSIYSQVSIVMNRKTEKKRDRESESE
jgi:hypothetical protein